MRRPAFARSLDARITILAAAASFGLIVPAPAQTIDCARLQQQIAQADRGGGANRYAGAARKQAVELSRTQAYAHQLGCDGGFSFFGGPNPQCGALTQRIQQIQANLEQLQAAAGGSGGRPDLVARFNAYCRGAPPPPPQPRGFFESLFGGSQQEPPRQALPDLPPQDDVDDDGGNGARGGSQAVCVRTCDGGFFPLGVSARRNSDDLNEMCTALCPGTEVSVFTRSPDADIKTAMGIDGKAYMDLPNALLFTKTVTPTCSCRPPNKSWAEALVNAEELIGDRAHKGDIMVTPEKSDELSRPKLDPATRSSLLNKPATAMVIPDDTQPEPKATAKVAATVGPDGVKRVVRRVGPQP